MSQPNHINLSRRERQIMDIIFRLGEAGVADILKYLPDPPGYNSVRVILTILEKKGHLIHKMDGQRYIYMPVELPDRAKQTALSHLLTTFFEGSAPKVMSTLLDISATKLSVEDFDELSKMIDQAKMEKQK